MSSDDPIESATKGFVAATLEWSSERLKNLVKRFKERDIAFIEDHETISLVKEQKQSAEYTHYVNYVKDKDLRLQVQMGLALRHLETRREAMLGLRNKIRKKYGTKGLHAAQLVQSEVLNAIIGIILPQNPTPKDITSIIEGVLREIDKYALFVQSDDDYERRIEEIVTRIYAHTPTILVILGSGSAVELAEKIVIGASKRITNYEIIQQIGELRTIFLFRKKSI